MIIALLVSVIITTRRTGQDPKTVYRHIKKGVNRNGRICKLRAEFVGGILKTTWKWVEEFHAALNADEGATQTPTPVVSEAHKEKLNREEREVAVALGVSKG